MAVEIFNVPKLTLHDRISRKVQVYAQSGPKPFLTKEKLASFLVQCAHIGYPHFKAQVFAIVQRILDSKGHTTTISNGWWQRFCQRYPDLALKSAVPLSYAASDPSILNRYYEQTLRDNEIYDSPTHIFNCDETGLSLIPKPPKVVGKKNSKQTVTGNTKSQF